MRKLLSLSMLISGTLLLLSCGKDDNSATVEFDAPIVSSGSFDRIESGGTGAIPFTITLDPALTAQASWTLTSTGDITASIGGVTSGTTGSGTVTVDIFAGAVGDVSVTLEVTNPSQDPTGGSAQSTVNFNVD